MAGSTSQKRRSFGFRRTYIWLWSFLPLCRLQSICRVTIIQDLQGFACPFRCASVNGFPVEYIIIGLSMVHVTTASVAIIMNLEHLEPRVRGGLHVQNLEHQLVIADHGVAQLLVGLQVPAERVSLTALGGMVLRARKFHLTCLPLFSTHIYIYCIYIYIYICVSSVCFICVTYHVIHIK